MTYDPPPTGWSRVLGILNASFHAGRVLEVEVRVFWLTVILLPLFAASAVGRWTSGVLELLTDAGLLTAGLLAIVLVHELGHVLAARRYGVWTPLITLSPLGGLAHLSQPLHRPRADIVVSLAGPATHLLWLAVVWPLSLLVGPDTLRPDGWTLSPLYFLVDLLVQLNLWLLVFNLLPFLPLDGGRVLRALLAIRMAPGRATVIAARIGMAGAVGFVVWAFLRDPPWNWILFAIGVTNFLACRREIWMARAYGDPWSGGAPDPWAGDADQWKRGGAGSEKTRPGPLARWRAGRRVQQARRGLEADAHAAAELDRVLARVSEVGLAGLTRKERAVLQRASEERRGK